MAGVTNGAQYAIDSLQRNVSSDNFVRNIGDNNDVFILGSNIKLAALDIQTSSMVSSSLISAGIVFPGSGAATTLYNFGTPTAHTLAFPVTSVVYVDLHDGAGVLASCALAVQAGNIPAIGSQSAVFSEAGVTAATFSVSGTALQLAITGKTVGSTGTVRLCRTA
jgi:hypothetical protein